MDTKVNVRELPQEAFPKPLEAFQALTPRGLDNVYPGFGWEGCCVDRTVNTDSPDAMQFCHDNGLINHETKMFYGQTLRAWCERKAPRCAKVLAKLGYPL